MKTKYPLGFSLTVNPLFITVCDNNNNKKKNACIIIFSVFLCYIFFSTLLAFPFMKRPSIQVKWGLITVVVFRLKKMCLLNLFFPVIFSSKCFIFLKGFIFCLVYWREHYKHQNLPSVNTPYLLEIIRTGTGKYISSRSKINHIIQM